MIWLYLSLLLVNPSPTFALDHFSISREVVQKYLKQCHKPKTKQKLEEEVKEMLNARAEVYRPGWAARFWSLFGYPPRKDANYPQLTLDGFKFENLNPYDLEVMSRLTMDRWSANYYLKSNYPVSTREIDGVTHVNRTCILDECKQANRVNYVNLAKFNKNKKCTNALCSSKAIFGEEKGVKILWAYLKFGTNMSPYSRLNADPRGLSDITLNAALVAIEATPDHLKERTLADNGFYRYKRGKKLAIHPEDSLVVANAEGAIFDPIDHESYAGQVGILVHELGHRSSYIDGEELDESSKWHEASGWKEEKGENFSNKSKKGWVSEYSKTNPAEDFAETYTIYRFDPKKLKKTSPARYNYMKENVFQNIEFDRDLCKGQINREKIKPESNEESSKEVS